MDGQYPLCLYRDGSGKMWDGRPTDCLVVGSAEEHEAAAEDGWLEASDYWLALMQPDETPAEQPKRRGRPPKAKD